jgi:hypothetical protein
VDNFRVYVKTPPALPVVRSWLESGQAKVLVTAGSRGFRYLLQRSDDLNDWADVANHVSDGNDWSYSEPVSQHAFYRITLP